MWKLTLRKILSDNFELAHASSTVWGQHSPAYEMIFEIVVFICLASWILLVKSIVLLSLFIYWALWFHSHWQQTFWDDCLRFARNMETSASRIIAPPSRRIPTTGAVGHIRSYCLPSPLYLRLPSGVSLCKRTCSPLWLSVLSIVKIRECESAREFDWFLESPRFDWFRVALCE